MAVIRRRERGCDRFPHARRCVHARDERQCRLSQQDHVVEGRDMAWHLAGLDVVHGATRRPSAVSEAGLRVATEAASRAAARCEGPRIDKATLTAWRAEADKRTRYVLDV